MQKNYLSFKKCCETIKKDHIKVTKDSFTEKNWNEEGKKIVLNMNNFGKMMKELNKKIEYVKNEELDKEEDINSTVEKIESEIENAKNDVEPLIDRIKEKTNHYACDFQLAAKKEMQDEQQGQGQELAFDLINDKEVLRKRRQELENIHMTAAQMKELTDAMNLDVIEQGEHLKNAEEKVGKAEDNADKAHKEIEEANKISKGNKKCLILFIIIIIVALVGIGLIIWAIVKNTKSSEKKEQTPTPTPVNPNSTNLILTYQEEKKEKIE